MNLGLDIYLYLAAAAGIIFLIFSFVYYKSFKKNTTKNTRLEKLERFLDEDIFTFFGSEFKYLLITAVIIFVLLLLLGKFAVAISLIFGALLAIIVSYISIIIISNSISNTIESTESKNVETGFKSLIRSSISITSLIVGVTLLGITVVFIIFKDATVITGFALGVAIITLYLGINGKMFSSVNNMVSEITEDNIEDNFTDKEVNSLLVTNKHNNIISYAIESFELIVITLVTALIIGSSITAENYPTMIESAGLIYPLLVIGLGSLISLIIGFFIKYRKYKSFNISIIVSIILSLAALAALSLLVFGDLKPFITIALGLVSYMLINSAISYMYQNKQIKNIYEQPKNNFNHLYIQIANYSHLTMIIPILIVIIIVICSYLLVGIYGVSLLALSFSAIFILNGAIDIFGKFTKNVDDLALTSDYEQSLTDKTFELELLGRKRRVLSSSFKLVFSFIVLLAIVIASAQVGNVTSENLNLFQPSILGGLILGGLIPIIFSALSKTSIIKSVKDILTALDENEGEKTNKEYADMSLGIVNKNSLLASIFVIIIPVIIGYVLGKDGLVASLIGASISTFIMVFALSSSKKAIEATMIEDTKNDEETILSYFNINPLNDSNAMIVLSYVKVLAIVSLTIIIIFSLGLF